MNLKTILSILLFLGFFTQSNAQCESLSLSSQVEVDAWVVANSNCTTIQTGIYIGSTIQGELTDISDLSGLQFINTVNGTISIVGNPNLTSLNGLHGITEGNMGLYIEDNDGLTNLTGLENIQVFFGEVWINGNDNLENLMGLNGISEFDNLTISNNSSLQNLIGLGGSTQGTFISIENNDNLTNLEGLENLTELYGELLISDNDLLQNLEGLNNLELVDNFLIINNNSLIDLQGLESLTEVWQLFDISNNNALTSFNGLSSLNQANDFFIFNNSSLVNLSGLNNLNFAGLLFQIENNQNLINLQGLEGLTVNNGDLLILNNPSLVDLTGLDNMAEAFSLQIEGNSNLTSLNGLGSLSSIDILSISNNDALTSFQGLGSLSFISQIDINGNDALTNILDLDGIVDWPNVSILNVFNNSSLSACSIVSLCDYFLILDQNSTILNFDNNAPGCSSQSEVEGGCDFAKIQGSLLFDDGSDCISDNEIIPLGGWKIIAESPEYSRITYTDTLGHFDMSTFEGEYSVSQIPPNGYWNNCPNTQTYNLASNDTVQVNLLSSIDSDCPLLEVEIGAPLLRRCFDNHFTVNWQNVGAAVQGAYIEINTHEFFEDFQSSTPFTFNADSNLIFQLGDLEIGAFGTITFTSLLSCEADFEQVLCLTANIFPNEICNSNNTTYSGAELYLDGRCDDGILFLFIENGGSEDMAGPSLYRLFKNAELIETDTFELNSGETFEMEIPADGCTYRLETDQVEGFPIETFPSITIEGCQVIDEDFATGFFLVHPVEDYGDYYDRFCMPVIGSYDPNDKQGFPIGYGDQHFIEQNQSIEYLVRFQNTGSDTAFNVVVLDTLSTNFDMASIELGASSHPFQFDIIEDRTLQFTFENIMLPDSNVNEPGSNGFFKYTVRQLQDLPMGTTFENSASIYFDFNDPVKTNTTFHSLGIATTIDTTSIVFCESGIYDGVMYTESTVLSDTIAYSVFENISLTEIIVVVPSETTVDTLVEMGMPYNGIIYETDTTLQEVLTDQYGCDSIVITNVLIQPLSQFDIENNISVEISPNPFKEKTQFKISHLNLNFNFGEIELFDGVGRKVLSKTFNEKTFGLDAEQLVQGVYFYRIILDEKYQVSGRVVKE